MAQLPDLSRVDLADLIAPRRPAEAVHAQLGAIAAPVPVAEIARALDICNVRVGDFDGFEGMLLTDRVRSIGAILANSRRGSRRARFTVAHELGHFLMERHVPTDADGFRCSTGDMREARQGQKRLRQETEANRFAIELLAPPRLFDRHLRDEPDLRDAQRARDFLDISLEAAVRRTIDRHPATLAAVWSKDGRLRYLCRGKDSPWITLSGHDPIPQTSAAFRAVSNGQHGFTDFAQAHAAAWTDRPDLDLWEQTRVGRNGFAVTLLWAELNEDMDESDGYLAELGPPRLR